MWLGNMSEQWLTLGCHPGRQFGVMEERKKDEN